MVWMDPQAKTESHSTWRPGRASRGGGGGRNRAQSLGVTGEICGSHWAMPKTKGRPGGQGKGRVPEAACLGRGPDCWKSPACTCQEDIQVCRDSAAGERPSSSSRCPGLGERDPQL